MKYSSRRTGDKKMVTEDTLTGFLAALESLRTLDATMPIQQAAVFVKVALQPGIPMEDVASELGMSLSSVSRHLLALSRFKGGHDLILTDVNPENLKQKSAFLTPKGEKYAKALVELLG
jgi:DNA-binding MarR family transcriptional regulator